MVEGRERRGYRNPSIEEAIVEFQFARDGEWDASLSGKLHQHPLISKDYPATPRTQKLVQWDLKFAEEGEASTVNHEIYRIQLLSPDGRRVITVGDHVLGISTLRPYDGWQTVRTRIESALTALSALSRRECIPPVMRIGVRYINRLAIPWHDIDGIGRGVEIEAFFNCGPRHVVGLPPTMDEFLCRTSGVYGDGAKLTSTFAPIPHAHGPELMAFLLDIDIAGTFNPPIEVHIEQALSRVDVLHAHVGDVFEASITDKTREVLDAE